MDDGFIVIHGSGAFGQVDFCILEALWACGYLYCRIDESRLPVELDPADSLPVVPYARGLAEDVIRRRISIYEDRVLPWRVAPDDRLLTVDDDHAGNTNKVAIFGASATGRRVCERIRAAGREVVCFLDNRSSAHGFFMDIPVYSPEHLQTDSVQEEATILASASHRVRKEMFEQLRRMGYTKPVFSAK